MTPSLLGIRVNSFSLPPTTKLRKPKPTSIQQQSKPTNTSANTKVMFSIPVAPTTYANSANTTTEQQQQKASLPSITTTTANNTSTSTTTDQQQQNASLPSITTTTVNNTSTSTTTDQQEQKASLPSIYTTTSTSKSTNSSDGFPPIIPPPSKPPNISTSPTTLTNIAPKSTTTDKQQNPKNAELTPNIQTHPTTLSPTSVAPNTSPIRKQPPNISTSPTTLTNIAPKSTTTDKQQNPKNAELTPNIQTRPTTLSPTPVAPNTSPIRKQLTTKYKTILDTHIQCDTIKDIRPPANPNSKLWSFFVPQENGTSKKAIILLEKIIGETLSDTIIRPGKRYFDSFFCLKNTEGEIIQLPYKRRKITQSKEQRYTRSQTKHLRAQTRKKNNGKNLSQDFNAAETLSEDINNCKQSTYSSL